MDSGINVCPLSKNKKERSSMASENLTQVLIEGFDPSKVQGTEVDEN